MIFRCALIRVPMPTLVESIWWNEGKEPTQWCKIIQSFMEPSQQIARYMTTIKKQAKID